MIGVRSAGLRPVAVVMGSEGDRRAGGSSESDHFEQVVCCLFPIWLRHVDSSSRQGRLAIERAEATLLRLSSLYDLLWAMTNAATGRSN